MAGNPPTVPIPVEDTEPPPTPAIHPEDPDDEWVFGDSKRGIRVRAATAGLVVLALVGGGFWGGVVAEKHHGAGNSASSSLAGQLSALRAARTGAGSGSSSTGGFPGGGFANGGSATGGTVIGVQGDVLEISDSSGNIVKVTVGPSATVTRTATSSLAGLQIGDTVVVTGSSGTNGTVNATAVRATAKGAAAGSFAGPGGFAGGGATGG